MRARSTAHYQHPLGAEDPLHGSLVFASDNRWGVPTMTATTAVPDTLAPFDRPGLPAVPGQNTALHGFLDDYRLERLWRRPAHYLARLLAAGTAVTPDYSTWTDWPLALNLWQVYRTRWLGCYWQQAGLAVIPGAGWAHPGTLDFAFAGIPAGSVVALQTQTVNRHDPLELLYFRLGYEHLLRTIEPSAILVYGTLAGLGTLPPAPVRAYPTFMTQRRHATALAAP